MSIRNQGFAFRVGIIFFAVSTHCVLAQKYVISTVAGGVPPATPAIATRSSIYPPSGLTVNADGVVFFTSYHCVFRLDRDGTVKRIAGSSRRGFSGDGGPAENSEFIFPFGITADTAGNIYVADRANNRVRKISKSGVITTVAGNGANTSFGLIPSNVATKIAMSPKELATDRKGNLYIPGGIIRKVSPKGIITTIAGGGQATGDGVRALDAQLNVYAMVLDDLGQIFFSDGGSHRIRKISTDGVITTVAGTGVQGFSGDGGPALLAQINVPSGITLDPMGNLFFVDQGNNVVRKISVDGTITTFAGGGTVFPGNAVKATNAALTELSGVAAAPDGSIYIAAGWIQRVTADGVITIVSGNGTYSFGGDGGPASKAQLQNPSAVTVDEKGNLFINDRENALIRKVGADGIINTVAGNGKVGYLRDGNKATAGPVQAGGLGVDSNGDLLFTEPFNHLVRKLLPNGTISTIAGTRISGYSGDGGPALKAQFQAPESIAIDLAGNVFVCDSGNYVVRKIATDGSIATIAGNGTRGFSGDGGPAIFAQFTELTSIAVDKTGNVFVADLGNHRIRMISPNGIISTAAGNGKGFLSLSGDSRPAVSIQYLIPDAFALDTDGSLIVAGPLPVRIHKFAPDGTATIIAGGGRATGDGLPATSNILVAVSSLTVDKQGRIYVAEATGAIRVLQPVTESVVIGAVVDAASQRTSPVSPGEILVIYGVGLGPGSLVQNQPRNGVFENQVGGTTVTVNGISAPLLYSSATQVAAIAPYALDGQAAKILVNYQGSTSAAFNVAVAPAAPAIFSLNGSGAGQTASVNGDGTINDPANPVKAGGYLSLYVTGVGQTTPGGQDGVLTPLFPNRPQPVLPIKIKVDGLDAQVLYAGAAPQQVAGLMQVVIQIPVGVRPGGYVPVELQVGDRSNVSEAAWVAVVEN